FPARSHHMSSHHCSTDSPPDGASENSRTASGESTQATMKSTHRSRAALSETVALSAQAIAVTASKKPINASPPCASPSHARALFHFRFEYHWPNTANPKKPAATMRKGISEPIQTKPSSTSSCG